MAAELSGRSSGHRPDGVFAVNDLLGIGMMQTPVTGGVRVPEDVAVVGYDNIEYAENSLIPLTSVRPPHEEFGIAAVDLLLAALGERDPPTQTHLVFPPDLVIRQSTTRASTE